MCGSLKDKAYPGKSGLGSLSTLEDEKETAWERGSDRSKVMGLEEREPRVA